MPSKCTQEWFGSCTPVPGRALRSIVPARLTLRIVILFFLMMLGIQAQHPAATRPLPRLVEIDKTEQRLRAYEEGRLVFQSPISTGKWDSSTPNGHFYCGQKFLMHYSRLYDNAPMPYSVHVTRNVFIHGFSRVPAWPASHGCIRLPLSGENPARKFYHWVEPGTPVNIIGRWKGPRGAGLRAVDRSSLHQLRVPDRRQRLSAER